ncbi:hypothetical protein THAOC_29659 [Thalassiosira oceanica]|uniref:Uncharacterized protein n=1 Tax=Thalassiosira oceanica TaxID=159749 RepID=K0RQU4_THAOC|nr:hypothetical protein THAOC_29659 [Thalassiosira oceanica]|eukprot:EJK51191.1 hypothetical protein THAOC_29659 [Thalassiosira oceanica]
MTDGSGVDPPTKSSRRIFQLVEDDATPLLDPPELTVAPTKRTVPSEIEHLNESGILGAKKALADSDGVEMPRQRRQLRSSDLGNNETLRNIARDVGDKAMNKMLSIENDSAALVTLKGSFESILRLILKYGLCRDLQLAAPNLGLVLPRVPRLRTDPRRAPALPVRFIHPSQDLCEIGAPPLPTNTACEALAEGQTR